MSTGPYRIEFARLAAPGGLFLGKLNGAAVSHFNPHHLKFGLMGLALVPVAGLAAWMFLAGPGSVPAENEPALAAAAPSPLAAAPPQQDELPLNPEFQPADASAIDGLKISSQHWRRGGLGSKALVTFTLRNRNIYAVKDIGITCAFSRRDGSHLTDRTRVIHDTVKMRSRKTFARIHVGFVNVNADRAKCSLVSASPG
jgi:hypothetical protein